MNRRNSASILGLAALLLMVTCLVTPASAVVFLNEIFINPPGSDDDTKEFIELLGTPGMKLDGYAVALVIGGVQKYFPLGSIPPRPAASLEIDEFFSLDGLTLGKNGILVLGIGIASDYPSVLSDSNLRQDWTGAVFGAPIWNGDLDVPGDLDNDGSHTFFLIRHRPGATQANPGVYPDDIRWGKDIQCDDQLITPVTDPSDNTQKDQYGNGELDIGQPNGGLPQPPVGDYPPLNGNSLDLKGVTTPDPNDNLEIVDEVSFEQDKGWEYDQDERHVDLNSTVTALKTRHVHALGDPQGFNPDALSRVDYRTTGIGWTPITGATGEMANGRNWQDTATEQWIRGESVKCTNAGNCPLGTGATPRYFYDNGANANPDVVPGQPFQTQVPLWLNDGSAPNYNFAATQTYQIMAGRINPLAVPFIPGDVDRDGDCDAADIAKLAAVFGDDDWEYANANLPLNEVDPATQTRPWDVDATGDNGIESSDLQWTLNFQGNTSGQIIGVRYDSTTPAASGVTLNSNAGVTCAVTVTAASGCGRPLSALFIGDTVDLTVRVQVTGGANNTAGQQNGVMQFVQDVVISSGGKLKVVSVTPLGSYATTRTSLQLPQGVSGDLGIRTINGYSTNFTQGLAGAVDLYRVHLLAIGAGSTNVSLAAASLAKFAAGAPGGLKIGHTDHNGNPASTGYPAPLAVTVTSTQLGDVDGSGSINSADAMQLVRVLVGTDTNPAHIAAADLNCDGSVNGLDIQLMAAMLIP